MVFFLYTCRLQFCRHSSLPFAFRFHPPNAYAVKTSIFCTNFIYGLLCYSLSRRPPWYPIRSHTRCTETALFWETALCNFKIHPVSTFRMEEPFSFKTLRVIQKNRTASHSEMVVHFILNIISRRETNFN